jgi:LysR family transcriptional regulator, nitrogen assimilation regulatory protein
MISLRQIRSFVAVYEEGSFTAAAKRERATQSGMPHHVGQLEGELGAALFARSGRAVTPTRAGELYYDECIAVLQRLEAARQRVADQRLNGVIRIGLMPSFTRALLPPVLDKFLAAAPAAQISITEAYSGVLTEMVHRGELDFAGVPAFAGAAGIVHRPLLRDRETLVRARRRGRKTPNKALTPVRLPELGPLKVVLPGPQNTRRGNIETYFATNGVAVAQRLELDAMMGTLQFVAASDWVAILPFVMMAADLDDDRFQIGPLEDPPFHADFVLIEPARTMMSPTAALFAQLLREEAANTQALFSKRMGLTPPRSPARGDARAAKSRG